jgi:hypothetical protein
MAKNVSVGTFARMAGSGSFNSGSLSSLPRLDTADGAFPTGSSRSAASSRTNSAGSSASTSSRRRARRPEYLTSANAISFSTRDNLYTRRGFGESAAAMPKPLGVNMQRPFSEGHNMHNLLSRGHLATTFPVAEPVTRSEFDTHIEARWPSVKAGINTPLRSVRTPWGLPR